MSRRRLLVAGLVIAGVAAVAAGLRVVGRTATDMTERGPLVPTAPVARGQLEITVNLNGELRAIRQANISAPSVGGTLRILDLRETGTPVKAGDVLVAFDPAEQQYALEQARSELEEAEQEIAKRRADAEVQAAEDQVALLTARFDVRRAELDAAVDRDLVPANEFRIREVSLDEARRRLVQVEQDVTSRAETSKAALAVLQERAAKARMAAARAEQNIQSLIVPAPMDGIVSVRENRDAAGGIMFSGMTLPTYRIGDDTFSGRPVIDVYDVTAMEIVAQVNEQERANVKVGQRATVTSDVVPGLVFEASVSAVSGLGRQGRNTGPLRQFDVTLHLPDADPRLRPGTTVRVIVQAATIDDVRLVPRHAVFERDGKPVVFVEGPDGFEPVEVKVLHRTETTAAIEGVDDGQLVALVDPDRAASPGSVPPPAPAPAPGGGR